MAAYAALVEPALLAHRRFDLQLPTLPAAWDGATIHLLTDLHTNRWTNMEARIARIFEEPVDLILLGGDLVHRNESVDNIRRILAGSSARLGVFGVVGNAERKSWVDLERAIRDMEELGVQMLMNKHRVLWRNGDKLMLAGVDDPYRGTPDLRGALTEPIRDLGDPSGIVITSASGEVVFDGSVDKAMKPKRTLPEHAGFRLLLAHAPQILRDPLVSEVDLILSGHTHGGQIRLPAIGPLLAHNAFEWRWSSGVFPPSRVMRAFGYAKAPTIYVSRGIATGSIHFRFLCMPEVQTITLRRV